VKKFFGIALALVMGLAAATTITGCPAKETAKGTGTSTGKETETKK